MIVWNDFRHDARVRKEAESLAAAGYEVTVFALHTPGVTKVRETLGPGVEVLRVPRSPFARPAPADEAVGSSGPIGSVSLVRRVTGISARLWAHAVLGWRMVALKPAIIHSHDVNTLPTAWMASVLARVPLIYDAHEISTGREGYASFRSLVGGIERRLMPRAAGTITTTDARAKFFTRAYGVPRPLVLQNRPRLVECGRTDRISRELGLSGRPVVLYQGGLQQGRGLALLVRAAGEVPEADFVFIGGGRLEEDLKRLVAELDLGDRVHFIPTVALADLPAYTASADIGVQPIENTCLNHFTTDSNKLFEYVVAGLPVVASDLPEIRKVVREYDLGRLVPPGDAHALARAIRELVHNAPLRDRFSRSARAAARMLNWEAQEAGLTDLYKDVLRRRGHPWKLE